MQKVEEIAKLDALTANGRLPVSVIVAARNEEKNLPRCLEALGEMGEIYVIDSQSTDATPEIARSFGANLVQFHYQGGWPKKRQWAMENLPLAFDWILLLDADEELTPALEQEIRQAIADPNVNGYYISLRMYFLSRLLRYGGAGFWKLSLFRRGKGGYECRLKDQDLSMADMEIHEHVVVEGATARLKNPLAHRNVDSLSRYIRKHDEYSNWEAKVWMEGEANGQLEPSFFGTQAQRRRWLKTRFLRLPGAPLWFFLFKYLFSLGFLDGVPGLIYCGLQGVQAFHIKSKIYELQRAERIGQPGKDEAVRTSMRQSR
ncbi:MAG TPA: glycosyltransferase family 2 protein [Candidatus Sulfotelmatobacter sp.]|jgi:glycosyltransferase involved in cell wall biosynthesis